MAAIAFSAVVIATTLATVVAALAATEAFPVDNFAGVLPDDEYQWEQREEGGDHDQQL